MIGEALDKAIGIFSPAWSVSRMHARRVQRSYAGAESNRLNSQKRPKNQSADNELLGPFGADACRAWARALVRDNSYANGIVETIATAVVGCGIKAQSMLETPAGEDIEDVNDARDAVWNEWCEVCDINGQMTFCEMQFLALREIVEAGEVLIRFVKVSPTEGGISRPIPLAIEIIEADRLAADHDTFASRKNDNRVIRGIEMDEYGKPIAYWIYPEHPNSPYIARNREPERILASEVIHLFRRERVGQSRGVSWFAPVMGPMRDLGVYMDNEIQASAVASCFTAVIKTDGNAPGISGSSTDLTVDDNGNAFEYLEPGLVARLKPHESIESVNPGRPNSAAEPWIALMLRSIGVGVGLGYEKVSRDFSKTSYSSARTSELEDRRRFKRWQGYLTTHLCQRVWDRFCDAATLSKTASKVFPSMVDLLDSRRKVAPVEWQTPEWEWVDPQNDQAASTAAVQNNMSTLQRECGRNGINWRANMYQRAKERRLEQGLGLTAPDQMMAEAQAAQVEANSAQQTAGGTGELKGMGRLGFKNTTKAMDDILFGLINGTRTDTQARVMLSGLGLSDQAIDALITDAADGIIGNTEAAA